MSDNNIRLNGNIICNGNIIIGFAPTPTTTTTTTPPPPPPEDPYNLLGVGTTGFLNPITWDYDGPDPDYFYIEIPSSAPGIDWERRWAYDRAASNLSEYDEAIKYDAKGDNTWYIPGNLRVAYVEYVFDDWTVQISIRILAETGGVSSGPSNVITGWPSFS